MTLNEILLAQTIARQRQTEIERARRNDLLRTAREVRLADRRERRAQTYAARSLRRIERSRLADRMSAAVEHRLTN